MLGYCPERLINEGYGELIQLYWKTKRHGLPFSGGWAEQPKFVDEVLTICGNEYILVQEENK